jgi:hypothetical protein
VIKKIVVNLQSQIERDGVGPVVQLVRMPPCHGGGRGFESRPDRKNALESLILGHFAFKDMVAGTVNKYLFFLFIRIDIFFHKLYAKAYKNRLMWLLIRKSI